MMDRLQTYAGSDSDTDSDFDGDSNKESSSDKHSSQASSTSDYFGLEPYNPALNVHFTSFSDDHKSENKNSTDIPDGDFWKGFVPDPTIIEKHHDLNNSKKDKFKEYVKGTSQRIARKHPYTQNFPHIEQKRSCSSKNDSTFISSSNISETHPKVHEKRKIFYVHSKVTPYLTSISACKCTSKSVSSWRSHDQAVNRLMWNRPNYSHLLVTAGIDSLVKIWNVWSSLDRCVATITHHSKAVRNAIWGHQGRKIISCSYDKTAIVTDIESGIVQSRYTHPGFVMTCTLHPFDSNCFVTGTEDLIQFWDQRTPASPTKCLIHKDKMGQPQDLLFIRGGNELISCNDIVSRDSADRTIMAWDVKSGSVISNQIYQERYTCTRLKESPSASHFLAQTQGGYVAMFSTMRPYKMDKSKRFEGHELQGYSIGFDVSHDGSLVYSGSAQGGVHCYDYRSGRLIKKCTVDKNDIITDVACHPVLPTVIASSSWGGSLTLWQ